MSLPNLEDYFPDWKEREALAEGMIPLIGKLYRKNVVVYCYGRAMYNQSVGAGPPQARPKIHDHPFWELLFSRSNIEPDIGRF